MHKDPFFKQFTSKSGLSREDVAETQLQALKERPDAYGVTLYLVQWGTDPEDTIEDPTAFTEHLLLETVPAASGVAEILGGYLADAIKMTAAGKPTPVMSKISVPEGRIRDTGFIFMPPDGFAGENWIAAACDLDPDYVAKVPGLPDEWAFYNLVRTRARVSGATEPQADYIATLTYRKAFDNDDVPHAMRAIHAINTVVKCEYQSNRNVSFRDCYEANKMAVEVPREELAELDDMQIFRQAQEVIGNQDPYDNITAATIVRESAFKNVPYLRGNPDLCAIRLKLQPLTDSSGIIDNEILAKDKTLAEKVNEIAKTFVRTAKILDYRNNQPRAPRWGSPENRR